MRLVLLNAFPVNAFPYDEFTATFKKVGIEWLRHDLKLVDEVKSFIRHTATANLLKKLLNIELQVSNELYRYVEGDLIYVVTLKELKRGVETTELGVDDLIIHYVVVLKGIWI